MAGISTGTENSEKGTWWQLPQSSQKAEDCGCPGVGSGVSAMPSMAQWACSPAVAIKCVGASGCPARCLQTGAKTPATA